MDGEKGRIGESFAAFLDEQGERQEVEGRAVKALIVDQLKAAMADRGLSKTAMAKRMHTSRSQLDRLFEADSQAVTLATLQRAAAAVGRRLRLELA